jgi:dihydroflavonol-4-reductase
MTGLTDRPRLLPPRVAVGTAQAIELASRARKRKPPLCREMVRTMLHGHRYDGTRAERELGLHYRPIRETFAATIEWALGAGLIRRELPSRPPAVAS